MNFDEVESTLIAGQNANIRQVKYLTGTGQKTDKRNGLLIFNELSIADTQLLNKKYLSQKIPQKYF